MHFLEIEPKLYFVDHFSKLLVFFCKHYILTLLTIYSLMYYQKLHSKNCFFIWKKANQVKKKLSKCYLLVFRFPSLLHHHPHHFLKLKGKGQWDNVQNSPKKHENQRRKTSFHVTSAQACTCSDGDLPWCLWTGVWEWPNTQTGNSSFQWTHLVNMSK